MDRAAPRLSGEPVGIDPVAIDFGMTTRRLKLASEHPGRQQCMTRERGVKPSDSKGRCFQLHDHITVGKPITHERLYGRLSGNLEAI